MANLTVSLIQTDLRWESREANRQLLESKINELKGSTELVVLPEMFTTGFSMSPERLAELMDGETVQWMKKMSVANRIILTEIGRAHV